nr:reverse transcriptase domain-containing protein [Tanacetum cinerariifolium]
MSRSTHPGRSPSIFSRLRQEESSFTRQRSYVSTTVFNMLGAKDRNKAEREEMDIHSRLGPKAAHGKNTQVTEDVPVQEGQPKIKTIKEKRQETSSVAMLHAQVRNNRCKSVKEKGKPGRRQDRFTPLIKTPMEILEMETVKFKAPTPMSGPSKIRNNNEFYEFNKDKGHNMDEPLAANSKTKNHSKLLRKSRDLLPTPREQRWIGQPNDD